MNGPLQSFMIKPFSPPTKASDIHPAFFRAGDETDIGALTLLLKENPSTQVHDAIHGQLTELIKLRHPSERLGRAALEEEVVQYLDGVPEDKYGLWVYYPWNKRLVHILGEQEFAEIRTNRNLYKITREERDLLATRKIGVIGLSVGQSVTMSLAMERAFGELRIADFDTLELSNMNRIRTGVHNLGLPKTVIVAREIAEIDPFLKVTCFHEGITPDNIDNFLHQDGTLDLLVDECDSLDIKLLCRRKARTAGIPVLMDTSDRGMIDIERFDLEPDRPLFHGIVSEEEISPEIMNDPKLRVHLSLKIAGADSVSQRMKDSLSEIGKTISTWPQLASAVALGGAAIAEITRKITLGENQPSGRFYVDMDDIIKDEGE
ncbi:MAG TPA: ThiF family adenylyltransferase [Chitinophagaceae bacterium]|nr:ThiF family adenylyltransferase [Chitinophagaceae bacterium]